MTTSTVLRRAAIVAAFLFAFLPLFVNAQPGAQATAQQMAASAPSNTAKPITIEDYARFKRIAGASISADGKWMHYTVTPNDGDGTLFVQSLDSTTKHEIPRGTGASFSDTSRWVAYFIAPPAGRGGRAGAGREIGRAHV